MVKLTEFQRQIAQMLPTVKICFDEPLSRHTSFKIGGPAEVMVFPKNTEELSDIMKVSALLDSKPRILGAGTNILAPDEGLRGLTISTKDCLSELEKVDETTICVGAGVSMTKAANFAAGLGLGGMEFAHGIPGSIGGGIYMNAGAYGGEMADICAKVEIMDRHGNCRILTRQELEFSYRHSILEQMSVIVIRVWLSLAPKATEEVKEQMRELLSRRRASQPLELPSAGSAFKRPVGGYAAALIDQAGLKGFRVGDAAVSEKHAGFVVNLGNATARNVTELLETVSNIVFEKSGIRLEPEIRIWK